VRGLESDLEPWSIYVLLYYELHQIETYRKKISSLYHTTRRKVGEKMEERNKTRRGAYQQREGFVYANA
jgi:hypothetical protein